FVVGDVAKIEISFDGGTSYNTIIKEYHKDGQPELGWFTAGTAESLGRSEPNKYYFKDDNTSIPLENFLKNKTDISRVRIKWTFKGTSFKSVWVMDNMVINKTDKIDSQVEWTEGIGDPEENPLITEKNEATVTIVPDAPGVHYYGATALVAGCRTYDEDGTNLVEVRVSYAYAGEDIIYTSAECGRNTIQLNAYDNKLTANNNADKKAYPGPTFNDFSPAQPGLECKTCDAPGTQVKGEWSWIREDGTCDPNVS